MNVSADDLEKSQTGQPLSDGVGKTEFSLSNVELVFTDGLPPIRNATVTGSTTGRTAKVLVPQAVVPLPAGRSLGFTNGSLAVADTAQKRAPGVVNFKLAGGADAFVSSSAVTASGRWRRSTSIRRQSKATRTCVLP